MKQEFITAHGKVVIERDKIFINPVLSGDNYYLYNLIIFIICIITFYEIGPANDISFVGILAFIAFIELLPFFKRVFTESTRNRILINEIRKVTIEPPKNEFETIVKLHLNSGKPKTIKFRKLENQYQSFIEAVSSHIQAPQIVI